MIKFQRVPLHCRFQACLTLAAALITKMEGTGGSTKTKQPSSIVMRSPSDPYGAKLTIYANTKGITVAQLDLCNIINCGTNQVGWRGYDIYMCVLRGHPSELSQNPCGGWNQVLWKDLITLETGFTEANLWLEWMAETAQENHMSNCVACASRDPPFTLNLLLCTPLILEAITVC
ncbi:hypothetical protein XENOCAPTIV_010809 [Xenoophorus captivus]|uniref:Uncharacterized protein n=1 Tax=Xenoophorus captivus TaxID=1517983 RepID=A0ABV0S6L1_9TELE